MPAELKPAGDHSISKTKLQNKQKTLFIDASHWVPTVQTSLWVIFLKTVRKRLHFSVQLHWTRVLINELHGYDLNRPFIYSFLSLPLSICVTMTCKLCLQVTRLEVYKKVLGYLVHLSTLTCSCTHFLQPRPHLWLNLLGCTFDIQVDIYGLLETIFTISIALKFDVFVERWVTLQVSNSVPTL